MKYYVHIFSNAGRYKAIVEAKCACCAEDMLIANVDSGDYDHFIQGRDFACSDVQPLSQFMVNSPDVLPEHRITPSEAQLIYYAKGLYPRKDEIRDIKTFIQFLGEEKDYRISNHALEKVMQRIYKKLYFEGFIEPVSQLSSECMERFWAYYHAIATLDDSLIDIPISDTLVDIIKRKAM